MKTDLIDISANQPCGGCDRCKRLHLAPAIDWGALDPQVQGVLVKATEGVDWRDPCASRHAVAATGFGRSLGAYHYLHVRHLRAQDARVQARQYLAARAALGADRVLPIVDVETAFNTHVGSGPNVGQLLPPDLRATPAECCQAVTDFVDEMEQAVGVSPSIYTSSGEWREMGLGGLTSLARCPLWLAEYDAGVHPPPPWVVAVAHQYTGAGTVAGVTGAVDCSELVGPLGALLMAA